MLEIGPVGFDTAHDEDRDGVRLEEREEDDERNLRAGVVARDRWGSLPRRRLLRRLGRFGCEAAVHPFTVVHLVCV